MDFLFADNAVWFSVPAIVGSIYFLFQLVAGQIGGDFDVDIDADLDATGAEFRILSLQTIAAFCIGSGWIGLAALRFLEVGFGGAVIIAILAGFGTAWLLVTLLRMLLRLQSSSNIAIGEALGVSGSVYVEVPPEGKGAGRVTLVINNSQRELRAVQRGDTPIPSRSRVTVVGTGEATNSVTVEQL